MMDAPHGAVCGALLPAVTAANISALAEAGRDSPFLERYAEAARLLTGNHQATPRDGIDWISTATRELRIPALTQWGLREGDVAELAGRALRASSMAGNPVALEAQTLENIIRRSMGGGA